MIPQVEAGDYTLLEPLPKLSSNGTSALSEKVDLTTYVKDTINLLIALTAAAAVFMIVWGGLQYMTTDSWQGKSDGKKKVFDAVIGLIMVLCTYTILYTVNPNLVYVAQIPKIGDTLKTVSTDSIMNQMTRELLEEANRLNALADASVDKARLAKADISDLQDRLSGAQQEYDQFCTDRELGATDSECNEIEREIALLKDGIVKKTAEVAVSNEISIYDGAISRFMQSMNGATDMAVINSTQQSAISKLVQSTNSRISQLNKLGAIDQVEIVRNRATYSMASIDIQAEVAKVYAATSLSATQLLKYGDTVSGDALRQKESSIKAINEAVSYYASQKNVDQNSLDQLRARQAKAIETINNTEYHIY